jgi:hypothetical protein
MMSQNRIDIHAGVVIVPAVERLFSDLKVAGGTPLQRSFRPGFKNG